MGAVDRDFIVLTVDAMAKKIQKMLSRIAVEIPAAPEHSAILFLVVYTALRARTCDLTASPIAEAMHSLT
jgi:hypothetical protein